MSKKKFIILVTMILFIIFGIFIYRYTHYKTLNLIEMTENDIKYSNKKPNVYLFWRIGCKHCEKTIQYLSSINSKYFDIYTFEVSENKDNLKMMDKFSDILGDTNVTGVPYLIVGNKTFNGFTENMEENIKSCIVKNYKKNDFDIYKKYKDTLK